MEILDRSKRKLEFEKQRKKAIIGAIISIPIGLGVMAFAIWIILKILQSFGVI